MNDRSAALVCSGVGVRYGSTLVLEELELTVAAGETVALLGPSGSGKTSLLGAVAGLVPISEGTIAIDGAPLDPATPPERRSVAMVFQNYALWPHMSAVEIVAYPLRRSGVGADDARVEAQRLLERVGIVELADRFPSELSGGQQQRVGLARALAASPVMYLFDEPTAHLDAALRTRLQEELIDRQRDTGAGALYASHDPLEALAVGDRLALLRDGRIVQEGRPREVYEAPVDAWTASLTGPADVLEVDLIDRREDVLTLRIGDIDMAVAGGGPDFTGRLQVIVRPEWVTFGGRLPAVVHRVRYTGARSMVLLDTPLGRVRIDAAKNISVVPGDRVTWEPDRLWVVGSAET